MKKTWPDRFARWAGWYLPPAEAGEVTADYRELLAGDARTEEELERDLGRPRAAARMLVRPGPYRLWLGVFVLLAVCLALPGLSPLPGVHPVFWNNLFGWYYLSRPMALAGAVVALVWFRRKGHRGEKPPRALPVFLAVLLAWCALVLGFNWLWMHDPTGIWDIWGEVRRLIRMGPVPETISLLVAVADSSLEWIGGLGMVLVGLYALWKARTEDRRWAAVYILAMSVMLVCLSTLALLTSMDVVSGPVTWATFLPFFRTDAVIAVLGLAGTGAALC